LFAAVWQGLKFYTEGVTGFVDVRDVVRVMIGLMESNFQGERFIISSENLSYRQVLDMIARELGKWPARIHASPLLCSLAWSADWLASSLSGRKRTLTRDAARSAANASFFSNRKIRETLGVEFRPISESIKDTACMFLKMSASAQST
jgi:nucleoside-diphosphate-sugar epimerase